MNIISLTYNSLMRLSELEFKPDPQPEIRVSDEVFQAISWLTGASTGDRKLIRCDANGALLINTAWSLLSSVETDALYPQSGSPDTFTSTLENKGVLISTSTQIVKIGFIRKDGLAAEYIYLPADCLYFFPNPTYQVTAAVVPDPGGSASYVGITAYN